MGHVSQDAGEVTGASDTAVTPSTRQALLALEYPAIADFDNPSLEWRRLFSEPLGTFFLVLAGAGGAVVGALSDGAITRSAAVTAPGLTVMGIILYMGAVSAIAVAIAWILRGSGGDVGGLAAARGTLSRVRSDIKEDG